MGLPKIDQPLFPITIPSTGKKTKFRPFTVKEEKILLIAKESKDAEQIVLAIKQIIGNCVEDADVNKLATFDIEYLLLKIRAKAADNIVEFGFVDQDTQEEVRTKVDIENVQIQRNEEHTNIIKVNDEIQLVMKYPTFDLISQSSASGSADSIALMSSCIDKITQGDNVFVLEEFSQSERDEFVDSLGADALRGIKNFFDTMPKIRFEIKYKNSKGDDRVYVLEGTESFFM